MTESLKSVFAACLGTALRDDVWQDLGFKRRPRHGTIFERFRPAWKTILEYRVMRTILATFTAAHVLSGQVAPEEIPNLIAAYTARADVLAALGYRSRDEAIHDLAEMVRQYRGSPTADWHILVANHFGVATTPDKKIPDKKLWAKMLVGSVEFARNVEWMIVVLKRHSYGE